jgi:cob(I)alamin adenosyltransferase
VTTTFRINRVYTRTGDDGLTGLVGGTRVKKNDLRVEAYGAVDELSSQIGVAKEELTESTRELFLVLEIVQQELFDLGSELATAPRDAYEGMWKADARHISRLESYCDQFGDCLPELTSFILPGGSKLAAALHVARTVARRAERVVYSLVEREEAEKIPFNRDQLIYLNRLSDLLFILARWSLRAEGREAPLWIKPQERGTQPL